MTAATTPSRAEFLRLADTARVIPVVRTVLADGLTPLAIHRRLAGSRPGTFLMESATPGAAWSRYSFIGAGSAVTLTSRDGEAHWQGTPPEGLPTQGRALDVLAACLRLLSTDVRAEVGGVLPHLVSGMAGFLGWNTVRAWERLPHPPEDHLGLPDLAMNLVTDLAVHDALDGTVTLIANAVNGNGLATGADRAYDDALARLDAMVERLTAPAADPVSDVPRRWLEADADEVAAQAEDRWGAEGFREAVGKAQRAIRDGEVFQAVVSRRLSVTTDATGLDVYRVLRTVNPSPYMYLFSFETPDGEPYEIVGSSPEALVTVRDRRVVTHPIAGSRRRGATAEDDRLLGKDLLEDEKERAEHLMLVDLSRNDLSRVCRPGTVEVTQFMELEAFSHILHTWSPTWRAACATMSTRSTSSALPSPPARCPAPRSPAPCSCWTSGSRPSAGPTAASSATSTWRATWTWRSTSARPRCTAARRTCRPAPASSPTPIPTPRPPRPSPRRRRRCGPC